MNVPAPAGCVMILVHKKTVGHIIKTSNSLFIILNNTCFFSEF